MQKHQFALFIEQLPADIAIHQKIILYNEDLVHRIVRVLRIKLSDRLILFDRKKSAIVELKEAEKKTCSVHVHEIKVIESMQPEIFWLLPLLEKQALESAAYALSVFGVQNIQLVITQKCHKKSLSPHEFQRLQRIIIAAAEQSKQFSLAALHEPIPLVKWQTINENSLKIFFDADGIHPQKLLREIEHENVPQITALCGPEGDLSLEEKRFLREHGFLFCALSPSILRAEDATLLAAGLLRIISYKNA